MGTVVNACERRKAIRFEGGIPVRIKQGMGTTRNFSTEGVYFVTDQPLSVGEQVEFIMQLCHSGLKQEIQLCCQGEVLRIDPGTEKSGIAIAISTHRFEWASNLANSG